TGRLVGAAAGRALKPVVLELGGKNPMIVFDDADLDRAVAAALDGGFDNSGQVCSSSSRVLLHPKVREPFIEHLAERARRLSIGPALENRDLGPLVSAEHYAKVSSYVAEAVASGARLRLGGGRPK